MPRTQDNQFFKFNSPLGKDKLLFRRISGYEGLSDLFEYNVEVISESNTVAFTSIVGKAATVTLEFGLGSASHKRYINGIVEKFTQVRSDYDISAGEETHLTVYRAVLRPWFWMLTLTRNNEIFQNMSTPDIIKKVFGDLGYTDFKSSLKGSYSPREYCVQYEESAFNFVSRLMEDEGIYYYFEHEESKHTMVLADDLSAHKPMAAYSSDNVRFWEADESQRPEDVVYECSLSEQVTSGKYAVDDFNFETPSTDLMSEVSGLTETKMRVYEYEGHQGGFSKTAEGKAIAKTRLEALEWRNKLIQGQSYCIGFSTGENFTLKDHPRKDMNAEYTLRALTLNASLTGYQNSFEALPAKSQFRAPIVSPKPRVAGNQTAIVTGKSGEEIWTDKYGRIKVQFHWDQLGKKDDTTTCWIRVNQSWAGKAWGRLFLPRIGQEVIVSFLNGDPDRPLVVGSVYNAEQTVPYPLPANQTKSTVKTRSSKGGKLEDFNEIRFEDLKDKEEFYAHAQKDMLIHVEYDRVKKVDNDETNTIKMNRATTIEEKDDSLTVKEGNRTTKIKLARTTTIEEKDDTLTIMKGSRIVDVQTKDYKLFVRKGNRTVGVMKGKETHSVKQTRTLSVFGNEAHTNDKNFTHKVKGNYSLTVTGNLTVKVTGNIKLIGQKNMDAKIKMNMKSKVGMNLKSQIGMNMDVKAGMGIKAKAGLGVDIKAGLTMKNTAGLSMKNKAGLSMESKAGLMMKNDAGLMMKNKAGVMMVNEGGVMLTNKAGVMQDVKAGAILMIKGAIVMIN